MRNSIRIMTECVMEKIESLLSESLGETVLEMSPDDLKGTLMVLDIYKDMKKLAVAQAEWMDSIGDKLDELEGNNSEILKIIEKMERMRT